MKIHHSNETYAQAHASFHRKMKAIERMEKEDEKELKLQIKYLEKIENELAAQK